MRIKGPLSSNQINTVFTLSLILCLVLANLGLLYGEMLITLTSFVGFLCFSVYVFLTSKYRS